MLNNATIMGRLTKDVDMRRTQTGTPVCSFTVAVDRGTSKDGMKVTDFVDCVAWRDTAEFVNKYFKKGSAIVVMGRIETRTWKDAEGNSRKTTEINASNVYFGESKKDSNESGSETKTERKTETKSDNAFEPINDESELPF